MKITLQPEHLAWDRATAALWGCYFLPTRDVAVYCQRWEFTSFRTEFQNMTNLPAIDQVFFQTFHRDLLFHSTIHSTSRPASWWESLLKSRARAHLSNKRDPSDVSQALVKQLLVSWPREVGFIHEFRCKSSLPVPNFHFHAIYRHHQGWHLIPWETTKNVGWTGQLWCRRFINIVRLMIPRTRSLTSRVLQAHS